jgi:uncharacterized protein (TIGR00255 family)
MPRSMTGFGRATAELNGENITVELSAVNHRYFDCTFRIPSAWNAVEAALRDCVKGAVSRGKVTVSIRRDRNTSGRTLVRHDSDVARQYIEASCDLSHLMNSTDALSLDTLASLEGVFYQEESQQDIKSVQAALATSLATALTQFNRARETEGKVLSDDAAERIALMRDALAVVEERLPEISRAYEARLRERVSELSDDAGVAEERLAIEIALMADRSDVTEEVVRLKAHFDHVMTLLASVESIGRELNFLAQEIQREINTLGSKLRELDLTREVLRMKSELEKIREQAQNIE